MVESANRAAATANGIGAQANTRSKAAEVISIPPSRLAKPGSK